MSCSKTQHLVLAGIDLPLSGLIQQTTKKKKKKKKKEKKNRYLFYYQENRIWHFIQWRQFAWNANSVFLEEWKNISKCHLLKTLPRMVSVMVCTNTSRMGLCMAKPTIKLVRRDESACTLSLRISSLIRAFANRIYLLQSMGLTKRLVRRAKTRVNLRNCIFWSEHSLITFDFDSRAVQNGITSVTFWSDPSLIVQYAPSSDSGLSKKLALYSGSMHRLTWVFAGRTYFVL